jgi:hypothetical protein
VDLLKGATIIAERIAKPRHHREWIEWTPGACHDDRPCERCGSPIAEVLAALGSLRCHDCRTGYADA